LRNLHSAMSRAMLMTRMGFAFFQANQRWNGFWWHARINLWGFVMGDAIKHGFANLLNIQGKDDRPTFWWWVLFVILVSFGISTFASFGFVASSVGDAMTLASNGVDESQVEIAMMQSMADGLKTQTWISTGVSFVGLGYLVVIVGGLLPSKTG
ncbi:MAG: hypothetical protein ABJK59_02600, partial [Erythrobacter sp.]